MRAGWGYGLFGLAAYGVFLLAGLPASQLTARLDPASMHLAGAVHGTLWQGDAAQLRYRGRMLGALSWQWAPGRLLHGELALDGMLRQAHGHLALQLVRPLWQTDYRLRDLRIDLAASTLGDVLGLPLQGRLQGGVSQVSLTPAGAPMLHGKLQWQDAALLLGDRLLLGTVRAELQPRGDGSQLHLASQGGAVILSGLLTLDAGGYQGQLVLHPADAAGRTLLADAGLGRLAADGSVTLRPRGSW